MANLIEWLPTGHEEVPEILVKEWDPGQTGWWAVFDGLILLVRGSYPPRLASTGWWWALFRSEPLFPPSMRVGPWVKIGSKWYDEHTAAFPKEMAVNMGLGNLFDALCEEEE